MAKWTASSKGQDSTLVHFYDGVESTRDSNILEESIKRLGTERYLSTPARRSVISAGGLIHGEAAVPIGSMSNPHGQPNKSRSLRSRHQISGVRQPVRVVVPPSQSFGALNGFTDSVREVSFGDSVDGFPLYVDEDGVMKISGHRQHDPFVFGYDAVEENDFSLRGGRRGGPARRNTYRTNHNVDSESFSNGTLTSDRYTSSSSSHEEYYHPSKQHRSQSYGYGHPYGIEADLAAGYEHQQPAGLQYRGGSGIVAAYDDDGAPVPIDAALLRHHYVASRRRRLVGVGSNVHARSRAKRPGARRKRGKPTQGGGSGGGGRLGLRSTLSTASLHTSSGRRGDSREVRGPGGLPSRLSGSDSFLLGSKTFLNTLGGASAAAAAAAAASASAAAASGIPSGFSAILSASTLVNVGPSSLKKAARAREYFLAREGEVKRRCAALRRRDARSASTGVATKGDSDAQKPAVSGTSHAEAYSRAGDGAGFAASNSDALTSHLTRLSRPSSLLRVSLETCDRIMGLNAGKAGAGTGFALATARSARSPAKGTPHQLHAVATAEEAVYVREGPASGVASEASPSHGNGVAGTNGAPGTMRDIQSAPVKAIHFEQGMVTLHDLYTGLPIASAYVPVTKSVGPAAAVHTCAAGIQFFRDPTAPRSSAIQLLTQASSALPGSTSQLLPTAYMLGDIDAPFAPNHADTSPVLEETPLYAYLPEPLTQPTTHAASFASAAHCKPSFPQPPAISPTLNSTSQLRPIQCPCCDTVDEVTFDSRSPRSRGMGGPPSAVSPIVRGLRGRDAVVSAEKEVTVMTGLSQMVRHTRTNTAAFDMVYPGLAACDRHAAADTLPTAESSGSGCRMSLNFGDSTRPQSGLQSGLTPGIESHITTAALAAEVDIGGGADSFSWRGRYGVLESGSGSRGFQAGVEVAAPLKRDEAACGWYGVWPPVYHGHGAPGKHTIRLSTPRVSSSLFTATPSYPASHHLQHNIRYNAWTAEGVSATSNTSCVVHVFTVSREMLRSVYEYVAYMCVAKRHAELQKRRRKHEKRLRKELAASGLTSAPQRCLRCPHCSIVGQVVRYSPLKHDSPTVESSALFEPQAQSPHLPHGERHHRHRYPDHSRTSHTSSLMSNTATATTTTPPPVEDPPQRLRTLLLQQRQQSSHLGMECVPTRGSGGDAAATLTLRRKEKTRLASSWPQDDLRTVGLATDRGPKSFSSFRLCDRVAVPPLAQTSSSFHGVAVEDICDKTPERQSSVRALLVNEVDTVPVAPPVSALPHSSASAPALRASRRPLAATGGSASGSFSALPPLAQSVLPSQLQTAHSLSGFHQLSTSGAALAQLSPTSLSQQQPLLTSTTASVASLSLARLHPPSRVSSTQWTALAATNNSSGSRAETLLDSSVVSGELSQSFRLRSPLRDLSVGVADRYTAPSSNDLCASRQQQPATTALARGADDTRLTNEAVAAVSTLENVEECGGATGEDAAGRGLSSRVELVDSTSPRYSLYVGDMSSDVDDRRSDHATLVPPHASSYPEQPIRMATGAHDLRVTCSTSAAQLTQVSSTDSPFLKDAPTAAPNGATTPTNALMAALKANMKATRGGLGGNPNARNVNGATTLLCTMAKSAPTPPSVRESANDEDDVVVRKRLRDTDAQVAAQDGDGGVWYVCHSCHHDVIPKRSLLTSAGGNPSSCRPSQNTPPQAPARSIPDTSSDTSSDVGEAYMDDDEADDNMSADASVMAFEDLLQDDALVHALHTSLCESLMMPSTREPPSLFPTSPPDTTQKRFVTTSSVPTNRTDPLPLVSLVEPPHRTDAPLQLSPVSISMEAAEAPAKAPRNPTSPMKAPSSSSSSAVPHPKGPAVRRSGGVVGSESIGGGNIGDNQDGIAEQQREILTSPLSNSAAPASLSTLSTPVSPQRLSEAVGSDAVMGADGVGNGPSAALSRIRLSLPCCGLTVSVLPHEESLLPTAMPSGSAGGSERRGLTGRPLTHTNNASHKHVIGVRSQRRRSSTSGWRPRPPIPRMREDAATRGLTPSAMLTSSAASSHHHDKRDDKKESQRRPHNMCETSRCPRRRHNIADTAAERPSVSVASSLDEQMSPNAAATATTMAPIIKGTFSSEKHRIQVNPRTPLDAVSKKRIIERIFHQNWLSSSDGRTTTTTTSVPAGAAVTTAAAPRTGDGECGSSLSDQHNGEGPASSAAAAPADHQGLTSVVERPSGSAAKADAPVSALGSGMHVRRHRRRRHVLSYTQEQAQHNADLLSPPSRVPTPLGVDLGVYRDSSLVLEIDLAYPRLPRGNVRELLAEWKDTCQPHPALVEAVIRNIIYSVLVQLLDLHATGRAHGSVKSTNAFPLWHAMESTRESGLVMPPPPRRRAKSRAPSIGARKESATRLGRGQQAEAKTLNVDDNGRRPSNCDIEGKDAGEAASTPVAPLSVQSQAGLTPQEYASKRLASRTLAAAAVETGATSPPKPRLDSESQPRRARHAAAGHLRPHQQMRPRHHQAQRLNMAIRETGGVAGVPNKTNAPASATLCEMTSLATPIDALSNGLATAMGANPCRSDSLSVGSGAGTKLHTIVSQSQPSTTPSSPSAVLSTASAPPPGLQSRGGASADSWRPGATPLFSVDNISTSTAFSPVVSMTSSNTRLCGGGSAAARLRRGSLATGDGGDDDDADDPNGDDVVEDDRMLVPLVAEVLTPPCAVLRGTTTTKAAAAAAAGVGTTGSQTEFQNSLGATPCYSSPAAPPRHRSDGHSPLQSCRRSGSWSAALEDPHAWLASAVPRRYVRGVEMRPPAAVWFPSTPLNKFGVKGGKPYGIHHVVPSADTAVASERTSGAAAELVLTRGPTGAVPHPQLGDAGKEAASAHATASANRARRRRSSTDPSTGSPAALHGVNDSVGQDAPDPLQWSRQVLLVDNIASVVATALRTAMTCVLLQRQSNPHRSHLSFSAAFLNSAPKAKVSRSGKVRRVPDAVAVTDTRSAQARSLRPADSTRSAARASSGYVPDVVHSPPPLPPTLFAIEDSEYVPAPELIRLSADEARSLRRLWYRRCGDAASAAAAAAAVGVKNERESGECFGMLHSSTMSPVDAETEDGARLRKILAWAEATESPATTLRNILDPSPSVSAAVDVWQLGMMALELADGPSLTTREPVPALRVYPWSSYFHSFVSLCLQRAPEKRGTVAELLQHPWFSVALLPQASSTLLPTTIQTSGAGWGTVDDPVEATKFAASRQSGMVEGTAPMRSTSLAACAPGVMGVECLTPEEKAEWEGYDYTLLYASRAQLNHPLTTATAAASAAVADVEEHHHQGDNPSVRGEGLPTHKAPEVTSSSPEAATVVHDSHTTATTNVMSIPGASWTLGRQVKRSIDTLLSQTAAAATVSAHSSALTLPSGGGRTAVALPPTAASVITPSKASAEGEMMSAMCTVDLAQSFAELIAQQWVLQQQQRVSSLVTGTGTYSGVAKGRQAMSLLTHNYFTPASAATPLDGVNQLYLPAIPTRSTTSTGEATAAYSVLPPHLVQPSTGQGAMSRRRQQQQPVLLFSQISHGERLVPMWRGHGTTLGNNVTRVDPVAVIPVTSSSGSLSPLLLTPRDFFGGGGGGVVRALPNPSQLMYAPPRVASADLMAAAANDLVPRWTARMRGQWDGMEGMPSQPPSQQTPSSTAHNACSPCSQLNARGEGGRPAKYGDRSGLGNNGNVGGASSGSDWHYDDSTPQRGRREQVVSGSSSGRSSTSSMTQSDSDSDSFALTPPADDATDRGVAKAGAARRRGGGNGNIMFSDPTTGFGGAVVLKEGVCSASSSTAVPAPLARSSERRCRWHERIHSGTGGDGVDDHNAPQSPFSSSPPTRRLLNGTIATALARLSRVAYLPSDSEDHWGGSSSSSSGSSNDGSTSFSGESGPATGSPVCGVPAYQSAAHGSYDMAPGQQNCPEGGDAIGCKEPREDEEMQSIGAEVLCDELLRCISAIQRSCPAAVSFWCVRMLQQAMRHPRTTASAARILQQIEGILPAERKKNAGWLKQPDSSLSLEPLSTVSDALGAGGAQCGQGAAVKASDGSFSPAAVGLTNGSYPASGAFLLPAELDASPSSFQNYEVAKWIYALHQALPRCT